MILLNFSHPITPAQRTQIEALTGQPIARVIDVPTQFDPQQPFAAQTSALVNRAGLTSQEWQSLPLLVNLPSLSIIAGCVLAELHGRCGYFPTVLRLRPAAGSTPPQFEAAELINMQAIRDASRMQR